MILKDVLKEVVLEQQKELLLPASILRETSIKPLKKFVFILMGIRRSGKSTLLRQYLKKRKPLYYLHFEDLRLADFETSDFNKLNEVFEESLGKGGVYFLDEVQNIAGWEIYVRSLLNSEKEVFITGSNSRLMSKELATRLTGRNISQELYPFSFKEFCIAKKIKESIKSLDEYIVSGGLPEYVFVNDVRILESLAKDIIYKDVLVRHKIRDEVIVEKIVLYLLSNIGRELSYNKIAKLLGNISPNTVISLMNALEDAYFLFTINCFDFSLKKQLRNNRKVYCVDNGFITQTSFQFSKDHGRFLENIVFIELTRTGYEVIFN